MTGTTPRVLVIAGEDAAQARAASGVLARVGYLVDQAEDALGGLARAEVSHPDLVVVGLGPADDPAWAVLERLTPVCGVLVLCTRPDKDAFRRAVRTGVGAFLTLPAADHELIRACQRVLDPEAEDADAERRGWARRRLSVQVELLSRENRPVAMGHLVDLSLRGAQVELPSPLDPGTTVRLAFASLVEGSELAPEGIVLWRRAGDGGICHGLAFVDLSPAADRELRDLLGES